MNNENDLSPSAVVRTRLQGIADELRQLSDSMPEETAPEQSTHPEPESHGNVNVAVFSKSPAIERVVRDLGRLIADESLLGTRPRSPVPSITVSGTVAVGLKEIGAHESASLLVESIKNCQVKVGLNKGAYLPPSPDGEQRSSHNMGNFWGLYSSLVVDPACVETPSTADAVRQLLGQQVDGAWGVSRTHKPKPYFTAHVLLALIRFYELTRAKPMLRPEQLEAAIRKGVKYLCGSGDLRSLTWSESPPVDKETAHLPTTVVVLWALAEYQLWFKETLISRTALELAFQSYIKPQFERLIQLDDASSWPGIRENEAPTYHAWLSVPHVTVCLLNLGISPWDTSVIQSLKWIEKHAVEENGIWGIDAGAPERDKVVNWSAGHALMAIAAWETRVSKDVASPEFLAHVLSDGHILENLSSARSAERLLLSEQSNRYWRRVAVSSLLISATIGVLILVNYAIQNLNAVNAQVQHFAALLKQMAANELVNFTLAFLGFLPLIYTSIVWLRKRLSSHEKREGDSR